MSRIFLLGSGPSLVHTPMQELAKEDLFVMNKFGMMDEYHGWGLKPKYYLKIDHNTVDMTHKEEIAWAHQNCEHLYLWRMFRDGFPEGHPNKDTLPDGVGDLSNTTWLEKCQDSLYRYNNVKATTNWHLPELCTSFGGMSVMMQLSYLLGYDEIYLVGCDLGYKADSRYNHAIPNYHKDIRDKAEADTGSQLALHKMAKRCCPVPIFNATVGGELEVHPRVNLMDIL